MICKLYLKKFFSIKKNKRSEAAGIPTVRSRGLHYTTTNEMCYHHKLPFVKIHKRKGITLFSE